MRSEVDRDDIEDRRREILRRHGADASIEASLLEFNRPRIEAQVESGPFPLADEAHVVNWRGYADEAATAGVWNTLSPKLPQMQFTVQDGISQSPEYRQATRKGVAPALQSGLQLQEPARLELVLHRSIAGTLPVLVPNNRADFELLVQAFIHRGEPIRVPASMGAYLVSGYNNWDRIHAHRRSWEGTPPTERHRTEWKQEFAWFRQRPHLFQDRFIILSRGEYSGHKAATVGLPPEDWLERSFTIRLHHECTHYFTLRIFGRLQHNIVEELLADFAGLLGALDEYRCDLARLFLGLEDFPVYRAGGRLENYLGDPPVSAREFVVIQSLSDAAVDNLEQIYRQRAPLLGEQEELARLIFTLAPLSLEELADPSLPAQLE